MAIQLIEAIWNGEDKKSLTYVAKTESNQTINNTITDGHQEWSDTIEKLGGPEAIDQWTERKRARDAEKLKRKIEIEQMTRNNNSDLQDKQNQLDEMKNRLHNLENATPSEMTDEEKKAAKLKELFTHKLEAFEIEEVKNSENRELRSRIRKSTSAIEISSIVAVIIAETMFAKKKAPAKKKTTTKQS